MKIKCIACEGFASLKLNAIYTVIKETEEFYIITNENGIIKNYSKHRFEIINNLTPELPTNFTIYSKYNNPIECSISEENNSGKELKLQFNDHHRFLDKENLRELIDNLEILYELMEEK